MSWLGIYENFFKDIWKLKFFVSDKVSTIPQQLKQTNTKPLQTQTKTQTHLIYKMAAYTVEQINNAMTAPVEMVEGPRKSKVIAAARIAAPVAAAEAAKERKHRIAAEKREAREQRKLDRIAKKAQKADKANKRKTKVVKPMTLVAKDAAKAAKTRRKSLTAQKKAHSAFKKELKTTRRTLKASWKEQAKAQKAIVKAEKEATRQAKKAQKAATPKRVKLTDEQKLRNKAKRAYQTEMNRRAKWERSFQAKFADLEDLLNPFTEKFSAEEPELEDGFVC